MVFTQVAGCILKGPIADLPAASAYLTDFEYHALEGDTLWCDGSAWYRLQGATKTEVFQNKSIDFSQNNATGLALDPFYTQKREGYIETGLTANASLKNALKGLPSNGIYSVVFDSSKGYVINFNTSIVENIGYFSNNSIGIKSKRELATRIKIDSKVSATANTRQFIGFSSMALLPSSDTPLSNSDYGVLVGMNVANSNFIVINNDGAGSPNVQTFPVTKDIAWHTIEIIMSDTNIICNLDSNQIPLTTKLPPNTSEMFLQLQCQNTTATSKTFNIARGYFGADLI